MGKYNYQDMATANCFEKVKVLLSQGWHINKKGQLDKAAVTPIHDSPWILHNINRHKQQCTKWHEMIFDFFHVIPKPCFDCYKVVIRPRTVSELFKLSDLQASMGVPCKSGIETREYTPALYGGYFYCFGLDEGQQRYAQVRKLADKHFDPDMQVYLKRACTEFEVAHGESDKWELHPLAEFYEKWVDTHISKRVYGADHDVTTYCKLNTKVKWIRFAFEHGDTTYLEFTDGVPIVPSPVTYHKEREES